MPTLSIVIPVYNMGYWLPIAVESCLWQSHKDIEIIIINDGSTDNTQEVIGHYANITDSIIYHTQQNKGSGTVRRIGQSLAKDDFITWIDADDFLAPTAAEKLLKVAIQDNVPLVCCNAVTFSDKKLTTRTSSPHDEIHHTTFCKNSDYWECKTIGRWIFSLPFLNNDKAGRPFMHPNFKLSLGSTCCMFDILSSNTPFSQCIDELYFIRQEHKYPLPSPELLVEQKLVHCLEVKSILLDANAIKPFINYLNRNYWKDLQTTLPYMNTQNIRWLNRIIEISFELFSDLGIKWFSDDFLHPEVDAEPELLPFAAACIHKEKKGVMKLLIPLATSSPIISDSQGIFQAFRTEIQSLFYNRSKRTKHYLQSLEKMVSNRITIDGL